MLNLRCLVAFFCYQVFRLHIFGMYNIFWSWRSDSCIFFVWSKAMHHTYIISVTLVTRMDEYDLSVLLLYIYRAYVYWETLSYVRDETKHFWPLDQIGRLWLHVNFKKPRAWERTTSSLPYPFPPAKSTIHILLLVTTVTHSKLLPSSASQPEPA